MANFLREEVKESLIFNSLSLISKDILSSYKEVEIIRERPGELVFKVEDYKFSLYFRLSRLEFSILDNLEEIEIDLTISKDSKVIERDIFSLVDLEDVIFKTLL